MSTRMANTASPKAVHAADFAINLRNRQHARALHYSIPHDALSLAVYCMAHVISLVGWLKHVKLLFLSLLTGHEH